MAAKMVTQAQKQQVQASLKEVITQICQNGFTFRSSLSIKAEVVILVDNKDMHTLTIKDQISCTHKQNDAINVISSQDDCGLLQNMKSDLVNTLIEGSTNWPSNWTPSDSVMVEDMSTVPEVESAVTVVTSDIILKDVDVNDQAEFGPSHIDGTSESMEDSDDENDQTTGSKINTDTETGEFAVGEKQDDEIELRKGSDVRTVDVQTCKNGGIYQCPYCEFCTPHGSALSVHLTVHTKVKMQCNDCNQEFTCISKLRKHMKIQHKTQKHICSFCNAELPSRQSLSMHRKIVHGYKKVRSKQCPYCDFKSNHAGNMSRHVRSHTGVKFKCDYCEKSYTDRNTLKTHTIKAHFGDTLPCDICHERFDGLKALMEHEKEVHDQASCLTFGSRGASDFECSTCNFKTHSLQAFNRHIMKDNREGLICKSCGLKSACKVNLKTHITNKHPQESKQIQEVCEFCSKVFQSFQGLYTHRKVIHADELDVSERKTYTCHICGKIFPVYAYLTRHLKSHESTEPYQCPKCLRTFKYHRNFKTHKEGCMNTEGFPCHICGKSMKTEYTLNVHIKGMHSGEKVSYPCRTCGQLFHLKSARRKHEKQCFVPVLPPMYNPFQTE